MQISAFAGDNITVTHTLIWRTYSLHLSTSLVEFDQTGRVSRMFGLVLPAASRSSSFAIRFLLSWVARRLMQHKSADPGLHQGRGGAWDHRRCGACFCWLATTLPFASSKMPKTLRGSFNQALRPLPSVVKGFKPAVCQPSGHCPLLLGRSSLPFASRQMRLKCPAAAPTRHSGHKHFLLEPWSLPFASLALCC